MKKLMTLALALSFLSTVAVTTAFAQDAPPKKAKKKSTKKTGDTKLHAVQTRS
jgi:hypothetical protein